MSEPNNIEFRSESVKDILGKPPRWIIRWGIAVMLSVVVILLTGSYFYKYPDIINARITITSENPPIPIVAKTSGKLVFLFVENEQTVTADQLIGIIENPSNYQNIIALKNKLYNIKSFFQEEKMPENIRTKFVNDYHLGSIHSSYASFVSQWNKHLSTIRLDYIGKQIESLQKQVKDYTLYLRQLDDQAFVYKKDLELNKTQYFRDSLLYANGVLADIAFENSKASYLKQIYGYKGSLANLTKIQLKINLLNQQIIESKIKKTEQYENSLSLLREKYELLINQIFTWEQKYLLKSAIDGTITFTDIWSPNQHVTSGITVFTVVPEKEKKIIGKVHIPVFGSGKVKVGQRVNIKLDNYPYMEYGMLEGAITTISMVPKKGQQGIFYTAEISLANKLITNYKLELQFHQEMQGTAEIITDDKRLIQRFIQPLIAIFKENIK